MSEPTTTVSGDAEGGFIVGVHDGKNAGSYSPVAKTPEEAAKLAVEAHKSAFSSVAGTMHDRLLEVEALVKRLIAHTGLDTQQPPETGP